MPKESSVAEHARLLREQKDFESARKRRDREAKKQKFIDGMRAVIDEAVENGLAPHEIDQGIKDVTLSLRGKTESDHGYHG